MPLGELEVHPYLEEGATPGATRLILGSFPVYECTDPDTPLKQHRRQGENTVRFFYGSIDSSFWQKYISYVDPDIILPPNPTLILNSLSERHIAISDCISSCQRHGFSSEDTKLIQRNYNIAGVIELIENGVVKVLCTSKGVLKTLDKTIICPAVDPFGSLNKQETLDFQEFFINKLNGNVDQITTQITRVFDLANGIQVCALAIPSPGSPQRQLKEFGFHEGHWENYADDYFQSAFNWLLD